MKSGIYKITNTINSKFYIGSAVNFNKRWFAHQNELKFNKHHCKHLQSSYTKHGKNCFIYEILEIVEDIANLINREQYWMDLLKPVYNTNKIAGSSLGTKASKETKIKLSKIARERGISKLMKERALLANIGNKYNLGRKATKEHKLKMSLNCNLSKIVLCNNTGIFFNSIREAALAFNYNEKNLATWLNGKFKNKSSLIFA
jgi:group I intron endonuclease